MLVPVAEINELLLLTVQDRAAARYRPGAAAARRSAGALEPGGSRCAAAAGALPVSAAGCRLLAAGLLGAAAPRGRGPGGRRDRLFRDPDGVSLLRHALVFARHLARSHRLVGAVLLALVPECADRIATRSLKDLETLAGLAPAWIGSALGAARSPSGGRCCRRPSRAGGSAAAGAAARRCS